MIRYLSREKHEECEGCVVECYMLHPFIRVGKNNGKTFIYGQCPCGTCLVKMVCNEKLKCDEHKKYTILPESISIYTGP